MSPWERAKKSVIWEFVKAVGGWWFAAIATVLGLAQEIGKRINAEWDGVIASEWLFLLGTALLMFGAFRAYRQVALERDELRPLIDFTVEFERHPRHGDFEGQRGVIIDNVWIIDHTSPTSGERRVLDFEITLEWDGGRWHFDKSPFQDLYRVAPPAVQDAFFSVPWQMRKNLRRNLMLIPRDSVLIPDQAMQNFSLAITDVDTSHQFEITEPGKHRLRWPDD